MARLLENITYEEYLQGDRWQTLRRIKLRQAGYRCQVCAARDELQVHHNTYDNVGEEELEDLCVLCERCHQVYERAIQEVPV